MNAFRLFLVFAAAAAFAQGPAIAPKALWEADAARSASRFAPANDGVVAEAGAGAISVFVPGGPAGWPGIGLVPSEGSAWDLSPWGRVEALVSNSCDSPLHLTLRVDNPGDWRRKPWNSESVFLKPREAKTVQVVFGYENGFKPSDRTFDQSRVSQLLFFLGKSEKDRSFTVSGIQAAGAAGDGPPVDPARRVVRPRGGVMFGVGAAEAPSVAFVDGAAAPAGAPRAGEPVRVEVAPGKRGAVKIGPPTGFWDLGEATEARVRIRNDGASPLALALRLDGPGDPTGTVRVPAEGALAPGDCAVAVIPFAAAVPWRGEIDAATGKGRAVAGTGTKFPSSRTRAVVAIAEAAPEARAFSVERAVAVAPPATPPPWLGKRPPVAGDWTLAFAEEFDGTAVDESRWNVHTSNFWDKRTHFSRDNAVVSGGTLRLRYERKQGFQNDDPADRSSVSNTPYACGILTGFGKTVHRYGYFEARMKLPTAPGLWPAFWMMPDRGPDTPGEPWRRSDTHDGGMEFDILEHLTGWGPHRFNVACHWDGYGKDHKAIGTSGIYFDTDPEGFVVAGMLWEEGLFAVFVNGREVARWEDPRVCSVPAYPIFYCVSGGWDNAPFDPKALPDEFVVDWYRVWRRK